MNGQGGSQGHAPATRAQAISRAFVPQQFHKKHFYIIYMFVNQYVKTQCGINTKKCPNRATRHIVPTAIRTPIHATKRCGTGNYITMHNRESRPSPSFAKFLSPFYLPFKRTFCYICNAMFHKCSTKKSKAWQLSRLKCTGTRKRRTAHTTSKSG